MNEELMTMEENNEELLGVIEYPETSGNGFIGALVVGAVAIVGAGAALIYKNRAKFEERKIRKLEKKGYVIYRPEEFESEDCSDGCDAE